MKTFRSITILLTFLAFVISAQGQVNDQIIRKQVLKKGIVDSLFVYGKWAENGETETHLTYLGQVKTNKGQTFKIVNSIWFWGLAHRATSRILVFNEFNQYVGNYYVTVTTDLPVKLRNGKLIFKNSHNDCDENLESAINFKNGLPKQFFRKCKDRSGDIYSFETDS